MVGLTNNGAFVGSKSSVNQKASLLSALVEAWRHLQLSRQENENMPEAAIIKFFAENKDAAIKQIEQTQRAPWPIPKVRLVKEVKVPIEGVYCFRILCDSFRGWHGPDITRFVY